VIFDFLEAFTVTDQCQLKAWLKSMVKTIEAE
jgi:hypothetical protein